MNFQGHQSFFSTVVGQPLDFKSKLKAGCTFQKQRCELTSLFSFTFLPLNNIIIELSGQIVASWTEYKVTVLRTEPCRNISNTSSGEEGRDMSFLSQQKPACTHDIFTFLPRCCHRKKIPEYKVCLIKHRWEQALTRTYFPFQPFPSPSLGPRTTLCQIEPLVLDCPCSYHTHTDWRETIGTAKRDCPAQAGLGSHKVCPKAMGTQLPEPQGSENVPAALAEKGWTEVQSPSV